MKIPIPKWYDTTMDWIAYYVMPPNKPSGLKLFGYAVTWTDVALVAYVSAMAIVLVLYTGNWLWLPAVALCMTLTWLIFAMLLK